MHRDLSPGNIIIIGGKAKISDLEFAKACKISDLQKLAEHSEDSSVPVVVDTRTISCLLRVFYAYFQP